MDRWECTTCHEANSTWCERCDAPVCAFCLRYVTHPRQRFAPALVCRDCQNLINAAIEAAEEDRYAT